MRLPKTAVVVVGLLAAWATTTLAPSAARAGILLQSDRYSYSGVVTRYNNLADALGGINPGTVYAIPDRDVSIRFRSDSTGLGDPGLSDDAFFLVPNYNQPQFNQNHGFIQIADGDGSSLQASDALFNQTGDAFGVFAAGSGATASTDFARLGFDPAMNNEVAAVTRGIFHQYEFNAVYTGLVDYTNTSQTGGQGLALNETKTTEKAAGGPGQNVFGVFQGVFENTNSVNPLYNGFYVIDLVLSDSSVTFQGFGLNAHDLEGCFAVTNSSFAGLAEAPEPSSLLLCGLAAVGALVAGARRRKALKV